jgi:hypothetical protein
VSAATAGRQQRVSVGIRIVITDPVPGVALALQSGQFDLVAPSASTPSTATFDFTLEVGQPSSGGAVVWYGPFTQGPPAARFVYITVGRRAGQFDSPWERRAKIPLGGISTELIERAAGQPGSVLAVSVSGRGRDGSPVCASVTLPPDAWKLISPNVGSGE